MGLINGGGFQYYGGPSPLAAGVDAFSDRFIKALLAMKESGRQDRDSQARQALQAEQLAAIQREAQKEAALQDEIMNLRGAVNMPGLLQSGIVNPQTPVMASPDFGQTQAAVGSSDPVAMRQVAMGQTPPGISSGMLNDPTIEQKLAVLAKYDPQKALALEATRENSGDRLAMMEAIQKMKDAAKEKEWNMRERMLEEKLKNAIELKKTPSVTVHVGNGSGKSGSAGKETEADKNYNSYVKDMISQRKRPMSRYQFDLWYKRQLEDPKKTLIRDATQPSKIEF